MGLAPANKISMNDEHDLIKRRWSDCYVKLGNCFVNCVNVNSNKS